LDVAEVNALGAEYP